VLEPTRLIALEIEGGFCLLDNLPAKSCCKPAWRLSTAVGAPSEAWRFLRGEMSPRKLRFRPGKG
jgi:hypothetical protein